MTRDVGATFFLGGRDLEMVEIAALLQELGLSFEDRHLVWGAKLSDYKAGIEAAVDDGRTAYAIELSDDMPADWPARRRLATIDHHGELAGMDRPTSLEQVMELLRVAPELRTRWRGLVSANDRGHVAGMVALGASVDEIADVRRADRRAQGVTSQHEAAARSAIARRVVVGRLTAVEADLPNSTAVADFILPELGGPGADRLLVILPQKLAVYGDGPFILALASAVPGSWWGGAIPERGFWGAALQSGLLAEVKAIEAATS